MSGDSELLSGHSKLMTDEKVDECKFQMMDEAYFVIQYNMLKGKLFKEVSVSPHKKGNRAGGDLVVQHPVWESHDGALTIEFPAYICNADHGYKAIAYGETLFVGSFEEVFSYIDFFIWRSEDPKKEILAIDAAGREYTINKDGVVTSSTFSGVGDGMKYALKDVDREGFLIQSKSYDGGFHDYRLKPLGFESKGSVWEDGAFAWVFINPSEELVVKGHLHEWRMEPSDREAIPEFFDVFGSSCVSGDQTFIENAIRVWGNRKFRNIKLED